MKITVSVDRKITFSKSWFILNSIEGVICLVVTLLIPADPQNALFLGYSLSRLITLLFIIILTGVNLLGLVKLPQFAAGIERLAARSNHKVWLPLAGVLLAAIVWIILWLPAARFGDYQAVFLRLKPTLLYVSLIGFQFYILLSALLGGIDLAHVKKVLGENRKPILLCLGLWFVFLLVFFGLRAISINNPILGTDFPPGAPLAPLQLLTAWLLGFCLFLVEPKLLSENSRRGIFTAIIFIVLWAAAIFVWNATPFSCTDDRVGPFAPNNICYPESDDAVYSIGSHYAVLGEGINNQWLTDKPLYMAFLAVAQWISGPMIDDYLLFQLIIIALIPAVLFLIGKKLMGFPGGLLLAVGSIFLGRNAAAMYQYTGSINIRMENPELLTALFLMLLWFSVFQWFTKPHQVIWPILSAGILGLSALIRFNPLLIAPVLLTAFIISNRRQRKRVVSHTVLFVITFCLVMGPWIFAAQDANGQNFYLVKIRDVILNRFNPTSEALPIEQRAVEAKDLVGVNLQGEESALSPTQQEVSYSASMGFRFLNNIFLSFLILPDSVSLNQLEDQVTQPIWDFSELRFAWNYDLSVENLLVLFLNILIILAGVVLSVRKFGGAGLAAFYIYLGYHIGNAMAGTSGGRYLEPVNWVIWLYFCLGIIAITTFGLQLFHPSHTFGLVKDAGTFTADKYDSFSRKQKIGLGSAVIGLFFLTGMGLILLERLPDTLPLESSQAADELAYSEIHSATGITPHQWQEFLSDPNSIVVEGYGYHPQYYVNEQYSFTQASFELLVLGRDHLLIGYLYNAEPSNRFQDGSDVILVGCRVSEDVLWNAPRIVIRSLAVIQLDNEENIIIAPQTNWSCNNNH